MSEGGRLDHGGVCGKGIREREAERSIELPQIRFYLTTKYKCSYLNLICC